MTSSHSVAPVLVWIRRDLRLQDHAALVAAAQTGQPVVPVFVSDPEVDSLGAAARWRFGKGIEAFAARLEGMGSGLVLRCGEAAQTLSELASETGASAVYWQHSYDPKNSEVEQEVNQVLNDQGVATRRFPGQLLFDPWSVVTKTGEPYKVFTPFWRAVRGRDVVLPLAAPDHLRRPEKWPNSDPLSSWGMGDRMNRGADVLARYTTAGELSALAQLDSFVDARLADYGRARDVLAEDGCSGLSSALTYGEISPATIWHRVSRAMHAGNPGAEGYLRQLVWRDFAWHLYYHDPKLPGREWKRDWTRFNWNSERTSEVAAWQEGRTGIPLVDAGMRELYATGHMHNRVRMVAASFLTKHLRADWRIGLSWFQECLVDWDPASNAMGWQWVAGCGPDAAPYFRVFNPETQAEKFDPDGSYRRRWIAEGQLSPEQTALDFFDAVPRQWALSPNRLYPPPVVDLAEGRQAALAAYEAWKATSASA